MTDTVTGPRFLHADQRPRKQNKPYIVIRPGKQQVSISKALAGQLHAEKGSQINFFEYNGAWYVVRVEERGYLFQSNLRYVKGRNQYEQSGGVIQSKKLADWLLEELGKDTDRVIRIPITRHAMDIGAYADNLRYPCYRLILDQLTYLHD